MNTVLFLLFEIVVFIILVETFRAPDEVDDD